MCTSWLLKVGGARIADVNTEGWTALSFSIALGRYVLVQWLLEEGGANITDTALMRGEQKNVWDNLNFYPFEPGLQPLLKFMVLLDDSRSARLYRQAVTAKR
jgi:hypothetical protein